MTSGYQSGRTAQIGTLYKHNLHFQGNFPSYGAMTSATPVNTFLIELRKKLSLRKTVRNSSTRVPSLAILTALFEIQLCC